LGWACGKSADNAGLPHFNDLTSAPTVIQNAAKAVVRITTAGFYGTGSFVSPTGALLTNNHVLGDAVCPLEGCYLQYTLMHQAGAARQAPQTAFAVPVAVDVGLDMALVQLYDQSGGTELATPDYLTLSQRDPVSLLGTHVTVVGHPEGSLKKWTDGRVYDTNGEWVYTTAYILPGSSGSPVLDDSGELVALIHRGPTSEDLITGDSVNEYAVGSASAPLTAAMAAPSLSSLMSVDADTTVDAAVANDLLFLNARAANAQISAVATSVLSLLASACDAALQRTDFQSPDDLTNALTPCNDAITWIECRTDETPVAYGVVCPAASDDPVWTGRFAAMNNRTRAMNGQLDLYPVTFGFAHLQNTYLAGKSAAGDNLLQVLADDQPPLDLSLANYLAAFGVTGYAGEDTLAYVKGYKSVLDYDRQATSIASAAGYLYNEGSLSKSDLTAIFSALDGDASVGVGSKLYVEELQYDYQ